MTVSAPRPDASTTRRRKAPEGPYHLDDQIGFILRQVSQRHAALFAAGIGDELTATQWAVLAKLQERGPCSQNRLGRRTAMDAATIKGVVDRLGKRGLIETRPDPEDGRRLEVALSPAGHALAERTAPNALRITEETLAPLDDAERSQLIALLRKLS
jgi:DNA-binding MarR family transcriptional regulator